MNWRNIVRQLTTPELNALKKDPRPVLVLEVNLALAHRMTDHNGNLKGSRCSYPKGAK